MRKLILKSVPLADGLDALVSTQASSASEVEMVSPRGSRTNVVASAPCPKCGNDKAPKRPTFTWWGGVLGPKLLHHAVCTKCRTGFNAKTGNPNLGPILVYSVVALGAVIVFYLALDL